MTNKVESSGNGGVVSMEVDEVWEGAWDGTVGKESRAFGGRLIWDGAVKARR